MANNWDGTAHIADPRTYRKLGRLNIVPDKEQREREIFLNPVRLGYFLAIRVRSERGTTSTTTSRSCDDLNARVAGALTALS